MRITVLAENTAAAGLPGEHRCYYKIVGPLKKYIGIPEGMLEKFADRFECVAGRSTEGSAGADDNRKNH